MFRTLQSDAVRLEILWRHQGYGLRTETTHT